MRNMNSLSNKTHYPLSRTRCRLASRFLEEIPLVLGSATPSLESWRRTQLGQYRLASLPRRIHNAHCLMSNHRYENKPRTNHHEGPYRVNLARHTRNAASQWASPFCCSNRRGFGHHHSMSILCDVVICPNCDLPLTHHRDGSKAVCHYCDHQIRTPQSCPKCHFEGCAISGLGTQRLEVEVQHRFPQAVIARMDSDTCASQAAMSVSSTTFAKVA